MPKTYQKADWPIISLFTLKTLPALWLSLALTACGGSGASDLPPGSTASGETFMAICAGDTATAEQRITIDELFYSLGFDPKRDSCQQVADKAARKGTINLRNTDIIDVSPLAGLAGVRKIDVGANAITDIEALNGLPDLEILDVAYNRLTKLPEVNRFAELILLDLSGNPITDLEGIEGIRNLPALFFDGAAIKDWSALGSLDKLFYLSLNSLDHPASLATVPATDLLGLRLAGNGLTDLREVNRVAGQLRVLDLRSNRLTSLAGLERYTKLDYLYASSNAITAIEPGQIGSQHLKTLSLDSNPIADFSFAAGLRQVDRLSLNTTGITSVAAISHLFANAQTIDLSATPLTDITFTDNLYWSKLKALDLSLTQIPSLAPLERVGAEKLESFAAYEAVAVNKGGASCAVGGTLPRAVADFCRMGFDPYGMTIAAAGDEQEIRKVWLRLAQKARGAKR